MTIDEANEYYTERYNEVGSWVIRPTSSKIYLGRKDEAYCRFCKRIGDGITFRKRAHAIAESLGNKALFSHYECDECNTFFGQTIETDFGAWSKPMRTLCRIIGKSGVPSIRLNQNGVARIDVESGVIKIRDYEDDPQFEIDEAARTLKLNLKRDTYTPIAVMKAFTKFGLSLMPADQMANFELARQWIKNPDHSANFVSELPLIYTFISGPMPNDVIALKAFIRKDVVSDVPYAFYTLSYANEFFQVFLPCPIQDICLRDKKLSFPAFPNAIQLGLSPDYRFGSINLNLMKREKVAGEIHKVTLGFEYMETLTPQG